ncbi:aminoglycoside phosphotransferase family protein [Saccharopolyspora erythraea]|uniref:aminoglycoside phosphotransferase family protein n=1 Tax=Saccharopolyspora erythraea TaxID=1836 RepID=UPI001BAD10C4|nr:aminoglycoside phosphotransferase family protein [Saccharopolyspora erythraea]QUH05417.1 aminoglycoside phosphotransferase family protein [Saccharopolyspora erythraea]
MSTLDELRQRLPPWHAEKSSRAVDAAVGLARSHGLRVEEPTVLADVVSVVVHLRPAPVVARIPTHLTELRQPMADWLRREIDMTTFLAGQGAPVITPSGELPPGPHEHDGFTITFWSYVEPDPDRTASTDDYAAMLVDLHSVLREYPGNLPLLAPVANEVPLGLAALDRARGVLTDQEIDQLRSAADRLRPWWEAPSGDLQPLHGDLHTETLIHGRDGLVWCDFEDTCLGPREWDLSMLFWSDPDAVARHHNPDPDRMRALSELRALHLALSVVAFHTSVPHVDGWEEGVRTFLSTLGTNAGSLPTTH